MLLVAHRQSLISDRLNKGRNSSYYGSSRVCTRRQQKHSWARENSSEKFIKPCISFLRHNVEGHNGQRLLSSSSSSSRGRKLRAQHDIDITRNIGSYPRYILAQYRSSARLLAVLVIRVFDKATACIVYTDVAVF